MRLDLRLWRLKSWRRRCGERYWSDWGPGAQNWRRQSGAYSKDLRARFVRRSTHGAGGESGAAKLFEQRREGLGSNIGFSAQHARGAGANECSRTGLYDSAARCIRGKRIRGRDNRQFGALLTADGALAVT